MWFRKKPKKEEITVYTEYPRDNEPQRTIYTDKPLTYEQRVRGLFDVWNREVFLSNEITHKPTFERWCNMNNFHFGSAEDYKLLNTSEQVKIRQVELTNKWMKPQTEDDYPQMDFKLTTIQHRGHVIKIPLINDEVDPGPPPQLFVKSDTCRGCGAYVHAKICIYCGRNQ